MLAAKLLFAALLAAAPALSQFVTNFDVVYGINTASTPPYSVRELTGQSNDINFGFGGNFVWLVSVPTNNRTNAITDFQFVTRGEEDQIPGVDDLAAGAGGDFRYLFPIYAPGKPAITELTLYRPGSRITSPPQGYVGLVGDINVDRGGSFLYLIWKAA